MRTLLALWEHVAQDAPPEFALVFYRSYVLLLLQEVMFVLSNSLYSGF